MSFAFFLSFLLAEHSKFCDHVACAGDVGGHDAAAANLTMKDYVAYIAIIRSLLGTEFVYDEAVIVSVPKPNDRFWINEHIKPFRPGMLKRF